MTPFGHISDPKGCAVGEAVLVGFIGWGLKGFFIFRAAKAADAESLRLLFIQLPILSFFLLPSGNALFLLV